VTCVEEQRDVSVLKFGNELFDLAAQARQIKIQALNDLKVQTFKLRRHASGVVERVFEFRNVLIS